MTFGKTVLIFDCQDFFEQEKKDFDSAPIYDDYEEHEEFPAKEDLTVTPSVQTKTVEDVQQETLIPSRYQQHGFIYSMLIKEAPLDSPQNFPTDICPVSRTKLFQEEESDMIMGSFKKNQELCAAQPKSMINWSIQTTTWTMFSPHLEHFSKWKQSKPSLGKEDIPFSNQTDSRLCDLDRHMFKEFFLPNQRESSHDINCSRILIHQSNYENWNQPNWSPKLKDLNFTIQWNCFRPYCATESKIVTSNPTQVQFRHETNGRMSRDLLAFQQAQDRGNWTSDQRYSSNFPKCVELVPYMKNARPTWFRTLQTFVWQPGTFLQAQEKTKCVAHQVRFD